MDRPAKGHVTRFGHGTQLAFAATVDALADECNQKLDTGNRIGFQIEDAVLKLRRRESITMPWD